MDPRLQPWTPTYVPRRGRMQRHRINRGTVALYLATAAVVLYLAALWWIGRGS